MTALEDIDIGDLDLEEYEDPIATAARFMRFDLQEFLARSGAASEALDAVLAALPKGAWLAGGAVRRTVGGEPLNSDYDFFFRSADELAAWEKALPGTLSLVRETEHHKHWRGGVGDSELPIDIQAIRFRYYTSAEQVIDSFDYTIAQFALDGGELVTSPYALWDLARRRLAIHRVTYPVATMRRMLKYGRQGYRACAGCMATLMRETSQNPEALSQLDVEYVD